MTLVHKGNIMKFTEGAFRNWGYEVAREEFGEVTITEEQLYGEYKGKQPAGKIVIKDRIADIMFQQMLLRPDEFDVLATPNLNGDYLSDAFAAQVGGLGIAPGANIGDNVAVFEATHGTAPKYANQDKVNPGSLLFSGVMMLEHMGWKEAADLITLAYPEVIKRRHRHLRLRPPDRRRHGSRHRAVRRRPDRAHPAAASTSRPSARRCRNNWCKERKQREIRRLLQPMEEMLDTGRMPHAVRRPDDASLITVSDDETIENAMHVMTDNDISSLVVEPNAQGHWGMLTRRDILSKVVRGNKAPAQVTVKEVASRPVVCVQAETSLREAADILADTPVSRLTVVQGDRVIGIVTETDIFNAVEKFGWAGEAI